MTMSESIIIILNAISILSIIGFTSYLCTLVPDPFMAFFQRYFTSKRDKWEKMIGLGVFVWVYPLIGVLLCIILLLTTQLGVGNIKARLDVTFLVNTSFWIILPIFVIGVIKKYKNK